MSRLLLIEDAADLAGLIAREMGAAGFRVEIRGDGLSGWECFQANEYDLVILDWMLPGLDGMEVLRRIRQVSPTPVLMLTARTDEADRVIGLELGADDYLTKPFSMRELGARVRAMLRRAEILRDMLAADRSGESGEIQIGPVQLNPATFTATLKGGELELTRTEFSMLHLLMRNPGRVFSRNYILDAIWGEAYIEGDRSVDNAILRLRKKLGSWGDAIETVWGVGYRLRRDR